MSDVRREAAVFPWKDLTEEQKQAGRQVHGLLVKMAQSTVAVDDPRPAFLPRLDAQRENRVLLIDGGRGSGKTALLLTVLAYWRRQFHEGPKEADAAKPDGVEDIDAVREQIVPVGLLDLHPLAPSTNLLMHVVGRLGRVVESLEGDDDGERDPPAWHLAAEKKLASRKAWEKLLGAVAAAWDVSADQRRARLDLEAYTLDLKESERQRLDLPSVFTRFVEALADDFQKRVPCAGNKRPLFLLAVDDADMNPSRSVELLDLLRMLSHPRVAFLLTGHSELFLQTLTEHFLGELRKPLRHHGVVASEVEALAARRGVAGLASDVYEKVIPAGQRCLLAPIAPALRFSHQLAGLETAFEALHADPGGQVTLASYFRVTPQLCEALPDRLRGLIDLADRAKEASRSESKSPAAASRVVEAIWHHAVRSVRAPVPEFDEETVRVHEVTGALDMHSAKPLHIWGSREETVTHFQQPDGGAILNFYSVGQLDALLESGGRLPRPLTAALMLAAEVSAEQEQTVWSAGESRQNGYEGLFAMSHLEPSFTRGMLHFAWPLPAGLSLPFYAAFSSRWAAKLRNLAQSAKTPMKPTPEQVDGLAREYIQIALFLSGVLSPSGSPLQWDVLTGAIVHLRNAGTHSWRNWAVARAGLLAAPEYGLPPDAANSLLLRLSSEAGAAWQDFRVVLHAERRQRIEAAGEHATEVACVGIDEAFPRHAWRDLVEGRASAPQAAPETPPAQPPPTAPRTGSKAKPPRGRKTQPAGP